MKKHTIEYVTWPDLRAEICKEMGIDEKYFSKYHEVIGGEYKNLWHVWIDVEEGNIHNECICPSWVDAGDIERWIESKGEWTREFFEAVKRVYEKEYQHINIRYSY